MMASVRAGGGMQSVTLSAAVLLLLAVVLLGTPGAGASAEPTYHFQDGPGLTPATGRAVPPTTGTLARAGVQGDSSGTSFRCYTNVVSQNSDTLGVATSVTPNRLSSCLTICAAFYRRGCRGVIWLPLDDACILKRRIRSYYFYSGAVTCKVV